MVEYAKRESVHPIGAVSKNLEGKELAEMYDMHASGAKAFSDGWRPIQSGGLLLKALQYLKTIDGTLIQVPEDQSISPRGLMHEGIVSTRMGLPGQPALAEEIMVERDLKLLEYTGSSLHFTGITSEKSIEAIEAAKQKGLKITCSVTPYHLSFCDEDLEGYDTNLKLNPPLRNRKTMMALREAVKNGKIDVITSQHLPQDWDSKECEFEYAKPGAIGLECAYGAVNQTIETTPQQMVNLLSINPRKIFHLESAEIKEGHPANLTLFLPEATYTFDKEMLKSKSKNCPYLGKTLKGQVKGTILHTQLNLV
jgi:dihydroorotase